MELRRLRYFVVLAHELHFGRAARLLFIAQPALSQQIKNLERELDTPLFDRSRRQVQLTPAGHVLLVHATELLARAERAGELTRLAGRGLYGQLRVGYTRSAPAGPAGEIVAEFRETYPGIDVVLGVGSTARNVAQLHAGELDAAFVRPPLADDRLEVLTVATEELVVAVPAHHPLRMHRTLRIDQLEAEPVVSWPRENGPGLHDAIRAQIWGEQAPRIVREEPDEHYMLRAVSDNVGIAICPASALTSVRIPGLVLRRFRHPAPRVPLGLAWRPEIMSDALSRFVSLARARAS